MAFNSITDALESRKAVAGLMGLAMREGFLAATTDHFDLTLGVAGQPPLAPRGDGGRIRAPDVIVLGTVPGVVFAVEVETRKRLDRYPDATPCEIAKLRDNLEVQVTAAVYARSLKGSSYDAESEWRQRDIAELLSAFDEGRIDFVPSKGSQLLLLRDSDLHDLAQLWHRLRGAA